MCSVFNTLFEKKHSNKLKHNIYLINYQIYTLVNRFADKNRAAKINECTRVARSNRYIDVYMLLRGCITVNYSKLKIKHFLCFTIPYISLTNTEIILTFLREPARIKTPCKRRTDSKQCGECIHIEGRNIFSSLAAAGQPLLLQEHTYNRMYM